MHNYEVNPGSEKQKCCGKWVDEDQGIPHGHLSPVGVADLPGLGARRKLVWLACSFNVGNFV
jgi:hypothetical protein